MLLKDKIMSQIDLIRDKTIFDAVHYKGHALLKHVLTDEQFRKAIYEKRRPVDADDIVMVARFFDEDSARNLIADTLQNNIEDIVKWLLTDDYGKFQAFTDFNCPTGEALVKNTDQKTPITVHGVRVILYKDNSNMCSDFVVLTAYPECTLEDVDVVYEAIDTYLLKRM